jgi:hypothetical protein
MLLPSYVETVRSSVMQVQLLVQKLSSYLSSLVLLYNKHALRVIVSD